MYLKSVAVRWCYKISEFNHISNVKMKAYFSVAPFVKHIDGWLLKSMFCCEFAG